MGHSIQNGPGITDADMLMVQKILGFSQEIFDDPIHRKIVDWVKEGVPRDIARQRIAEYLEANPYFWNEHGSRWDRLWAWLKNWVVR